LYCGDLWGTTNLIFGTLLIISSIIERRIGWFK
jgi:hypothetical protein